MEIKLIAGVRGYNPEIGKKEVSIDNLHEVILLSDQQNPLEGKVGKKVSGIKEYTRITITFQPEHPLPFWQVPNLRQIKELGIRNVIFPLYCQIVRGKYNVAEGTCSATLIYYY